MAYQAPAIQFRSSGGRIALKKHSVTQLNSFIWFTKLIYI